MKRTIDLEFITPLFSHGAIDAPEVRASSIRGQLHAWFRILGGDVEAERRVFGGIRQKKSGFEYNAQQSNDVGKPNCRSRCKC